uniref:Uncharacterized protein n=1 Tax=Ciona savignyi TaxID=51511 RepID=H2YK60_CIOSA
MEFYFELKMGAKDGSLNKYELRDCRTQILFCAIYIMTLVLITGIRNTNNRPLYLLLSAVITSEICCYILVTALFINFDSLGTVDVRLKALTLFFEVMSGTIFRFLKLSLCMGVGETQLQDQVKPLIPLVLNSAYMLFSLGYNFSKFHQSNQFVVMSMKIFALITDGLIMYFAVWLYTNRKYLTLPDSNYGKLSKIFITFGIICVVSIGLMTITMTIFCRFDWIFLGLINVSCLAIRWSFVTTIILIYR